MIKADNLQIFFHITPYEDSEFKKNQTHPQPELFLEGIKKIGRVPRIFKNIIKSNLCSMAQSE